MWLKITAGEFFLYADVLVWTDGKKQDSIQLMFEQNTFAVKMA